MLLLDRQPVFLVFCRAVLVAFFASCILPVVTRGQSPLRKDSRFEVIDAAEAALRLDAFRNQRLDGDFCFRFQLEHLPRRGPSVRYYGSMWGSWNENGPVTRIQLNEKKNGESKSQVELIFQNGPKPMAWMRNADNGCFIELKGAALFQPLLPEIVYTPFDFLMPFLYWEHFNYVGSERVRSRIARNFLMLPDAASFIPNWLQAVRIGIDDAYNALLHIEIIEKPDRTRSSFTIESFKQVQGQWIVKGIVMKDWKTRNRTRFTVLSASVGLIFPDAVFSPTNTTDLPLIPDALFEDL
ncbi:MAG: hypothetical protein ACON39_07645 [Coraliomargaritaceae bacterium]